MKRLLVACEESQRVTAAFRAKGREAYSCDLQEPSGGYPEWHILGDCLPLLGAGVCEFETMDGVQHTVACWDMLIAHPPCTYLTNAGAVRMRVNSEIVPERYAKMLEGREFFMQFINADVPKICVENPVPMRICELPKYTQIIQPYECGHPYSKRTCLWLKGLPKLRPTNIIQNHTPYVNGGCKNWDGTYRRAQGRNERDPKQRSKTFHGIANAMAEQWG